MYSYFLQTYCVPLFPKLKLNNIFKVPGAIMLARPQARVVTGVYSTTRQLEKDSLTAIISLFPFIIIISSLLTSFHFQAQSISSLSQ